MFVQWDYGVMYLWIFVLSIVNVDGEGYYVETSEAVPEGYVAYDAGSAYFNNMLFTVDDKLLREFMRQQMYVVYMQW